MRVSLLKSSGRIIEMQSDATEGTVTANAIAMGFPAADVEERVVTPEEYQAMLPPPPVVLSKSEVVSRLHKAGKLEAWSEAINKDILRRELWYSPDKPSVAATDPDLLAVLESIDAKNVLTG
jgi:hypothetical protein